MADDGSMLDIPALERELLHIRSVTAARILCSNTGVIDEIHIVGTPTRNPKQVVRDIETILLVQHHIRVDHRKVSLVQMDDRRLSAAPQRILLIDIQLLSIEDVPTATVTLALQDTHVIGVSRARTDHPTASEQLVAFAVVHALDQLVTPRGHVRLEQLQLQQLGGLEVCLAHLSLLADESLETLVGVSIVAGDNNGASARSVLDALNRRLPRLLQG